jgi:dTMP kinase
MSSGIGRGRIGHRGLFLSVDGVDPVATAGYTALVVDAIRSRQFLVAETAEPTDSPIGHRVGELLRGPSTASADGAVEPETAALLSAADRAEHVAAVIRPALERGEVVVCNRYVLTSLALHGGGRGADVERIRAVNSWSTGGLLPDLTLVVKGVSETGIAMTGGFEDLDEELVDQTLVAEADADPNRYAVCPAEVPEALPADLLLRLNRLVDARASLIAATHVGPGTTTR